MTTGSLLPKNPALAERYMLYVVGSAHYEAGVFGKGYDFTVE